MDGEALAEAIRGAQRGEAGSFDLLVDWYSGRVFGFLFRMTGARDDSEDLMQEVFVRLVRMLPAYRDDGRFEAWLFRIAANLARDRLRRTRRAPGQVGFGRPEDQAGAAGAPSIEELAGEDEPVDGALVRGEELDALAEALARLPDSEREVIMLRHFSQLSFKDIAEATGTPLGTALARSHRGLIRLREIMREIESEQESRGARARAAARTSVS